MAKVVDDQRNLVMHGILSLQRQQAHDSVEDAASLKRARQRHRKTFAEKRPRLI